MPSGRRSPFLRLKSFVRSHRILSVFILFAAIVASPGFSYYVMSYSSASRTTIQIFSVDRFVNDLDVMHYGNVTFDLQVHVLSQSASMNIYVSNPTFNLVVDSYDLGTVFGHSDTLNPNQQVVYYFIFRAPTGPDSDSVAQTIASASSNRLVLTMHALEMAGWYQGQVTRSDSSAWTFSG